MFESIFKIIRKRREKDFKISMLTTLIPTPKPSDSSAPSTSRSSGTNPSVKDDLDDPEELEKQLQDPAETDPELLAKLEANVRLRKSEAEVIDRFATLNPEELSRDNNSAGGEESDNDDDEDEEEEDDDYQAEERQLSKHHQKAELTEDEDEEQETVGYDGSTLTGGRRLSCDSSIDGKANEDDDTSNDGNPTTGGESEMDGDTDVDNIIEGIGKEAQTENASNAPASLPDAAIVSQPEVQKVEDDQSVKASDAIKRTATVDNDDDDKVDGEPPAKRMRADENFNEERVVSKSVTESEEAAVNSVPAPAVVMESSLD